MSAGTGIQHSEYNPDNENPLHLYQIWILPEQDNIEPRYEQKRFSDENGQQLVLSPDAREGSLKVYQDMTLWRWKLSQGQTQHFDIEKGRVVWVQIVKGAVSVNGQSASTSDGFAIWQESHLTINAEKESEILIFDLPATE